MRVLVRTGDCSCQIPTDTSCSSAAGAAGAAAGIGRSPLSQIAARLETQQRTRTERTGTYLVDHAMLPLTVDRSSLRTLPPPLREQR